MAASSWKAFDAFAKPVDGLRTQSSAGGAITLLASVAAGLLFLSQLILYAQVDIKHSLHLAESVWTPLPESTVHLNPLEAFNSNKHKIRVFLHVTFPHVPCSDLDYNLNGQALKDQKQAGMPKLSMIPPTAEEYRKATGGTTQNKEGGCTIRGSSMRVEQAGGSFGVAITPRAFQTAIQAFQMETMMGLNHGTMGGRDNFNVTHYIHDLRFGTMFPLATNPLKDAPFVIHNEGPGGGIALNNVKVKLIPTKYKRFARRAQDTYQLGVTQHLVKAQTMAQSGVNLNPGLFVSFDLTPLAVHHEERREHFLIFLSSLMSIVGGAFVTVGLVSRCLVGSAAAIAKKLD